MPGPLTGSPLVGFVGKIPARGDFVRAGLPRDFTDPWDEWLSAAVGGSRALMGNGWLDAFLEAPVWRFVLPPGFCGPRAVVGLILPSVDKVGRYFPLSFAALVENGTPDAEDWSGWLDAVEELGLMALDDEAPPEQLTPPPAPENYRLSSQPMTSWWTDGGPRVEAVQLLLPELPDPARFAYMLGHLVPTENA